MKKLNVLLTLSSFAMLGAALASCGSKAADADVTLVVYNWEDYIDTGKDDDGNPRLDEDGNEEKGTIALFEDYYKEKHGKTIHVDYETFSTCEDMYNQIKAGSIKADLVCPSDYMIQRMQAENMLESFGFDYAKSTYGDAIANFDNYGSPYIKSLFEGNQFSDFAVPYFWGTMGLTYNPEASETIEDDITSWEILWSDNAAYKGKMTVKDSVRDTIFTAIMHNNKATLDDLADKYAKEEITAKAYNDRISEIFNDCSDAALEGAKNALIGLASNIKGLEVDDGKNDIIDGKIAINLAWSGDSVYSMDEAENSEVYLGYSVPSEGSNVWFDGWCMPKGAQVEAAKEFVNFLCDPEIAARNMDVTGYTSPIAGDAIFDLCKEWYSIDAYEEGEYTEEDCDECDLSYFFQGTLSEGKEAKVLVPSEERGRQFDAQFPSEETIVRCAVMKDFGSQTAKLNQIWADFKARLH